MQINYAEVLAVPESILLSVATETIAMTTEFEVLFHQVGTKDVAQIRAVNMVNFPKIIPHNVRHLKKKKLC